MTVKNMDQIVEMCRKTVDDIIASVGGVGDLLQDGGKMALIEMIGNKLNQLGADVNAVLGTELANAYFQGIVDADAFMSSNGVDVSVHGFNKQIHLAGVDRIVGDTMQDMNASFRTAMMLGIADVDRVLDNVKDEIGKGMILGHSSNVASKRVEQAFAQSGMTAFVTKDGKKLPLDFYAQTVTRTKYRTAHTTGAVARYMESGVYHVKINEHHPTCSKCARFQGLVVALDADHAQGFPVADVDIPLPPYHPNCQHVARPYVLDYHSETDIANEKKKWNNFDPDGDPRTMAQKELYKNEQSIRRKARQEMKEYDLMKATLTGDDLDKLPKTLGAYRRLKRKGDSKWIGLQQAYKKNADVVIAKGPTDRGTPKKRKGSRTGSSTGLRLGMATKTSKRTKQTSPSQTKRTPPSQTSPAPVPIPPPVKPRYNVKLEKADQTAINNFEKAIDGIEYKDRRSATKHILASIPKNAMKIRIAKISANGHVAKITAPGGKIKIGEFALRSNDYRPEQYQYKTMYHEFYHANMEGLHYPGFDSTWTKWEETATESSAFFMADRAGFDVKKIAPSYSEYLVETLPNLKQLPEFADAENMVDFGAKFMKYRFDPDHKTADWTSLRKQVDALPKKVNVDDYFRTHYVDHVEQNKERYVDMIFDSLQQEKAQHETWIKNQIRSGLEKGIASKTVNREVRMILPVAMNEVGIKTP